MKLVAPLWPVVVNEFHPERIIAILEKHQVEYVMIGGLAAAIHGSDLVTTDVDITPSLAPDNVTRLSAALRELRARIRTADNPEGLPFAHDGQSLSRATTWNLVTDAGDLDISFTPSGTRGFADLRQDAVAIELLGSTTIVASLADIIRSKQAAGRPKDIAALPLLRRLLDEIERRSR